MLHFPAYQNIISMYSYIRGCNTQSRTFETGLPTGRLKLIKLISLYCDN